MGTAEGGPITSSWKTIGITTMAQVVQNRVQHGSIASQMCSMRNLCALLCGIYARAEASRAIFQKCKEYGGHFLRMDLD